MANASRDENHTPTLIAVLNTDGQTILPVKVNASNHGLSVDGGSTGSDNGPDEALHDANHISTIMGVSETDGVTPVPIYTDSSGNLLIDSN